MYAPRSSALLSLLLMSACSGKDDDNQETGTIDTADSADTDVGETAHTAETALDDEDLPESTVTVEEDLVWDEDVSIGSLIYIPAGVTLTVMPGVHISFQPGAGISVAGTLLLTGNEDAPVTFSNDADLGGANYGLNVGGTGDASVLNYASFTGIDVTLEGQATDLIHNVAFSDATLNVLSRSALFTVEDCTFTDNARDGQTSLNASDLPELLVTTSTFSDGAYGVHFNGLADGATLTVSSSSFDAMSVAVRVGDQGEYGHIVNLSALEITNATEDGVALYRSDAVVSNVTISGALEDGFYADALSEVLADELAVSGADGSCVDVLGGASLARLTVKSCGSHGIYLGESGAEVSESSVSDVDSVGIYANAALTVSDTTVDGTPSHGIYALNGALSVSDVLVSNARGSGIYAEQGSLTARDTTVTDVAGNGFYAAYGDVLVSDVTAEGVRGQGIYAYRGALTIEAGSSGTEVRDVEGSGVYAYDGLLTVTDLTVYDVRGYGIYVYYDNASVSDTIITSALSGGIYVTRGDILVFAEATGVQISDVDGVGIYANTGNITASDVEIEDVRSHGVYSVYGDTELSDTTISGAGGIGVYVSEGTLMATEVTVSTVESHGFYASDGDMALTDCEVFSTDGHGASVNTGDMTVDGLTVEGAGTYGIYVLGGTDGETDYSGDLSNVQVSETLSAGIVGSRASLVVTDATVTDSGAQGIYVVNGNLSVSDSSVSNTESHGYYVSDGYLELIDSEVANVRNSGVAVSVGAASIDGLFVTDADGTGESTGDNGITLSDPWAGYTSSITNCTIEDVGAIGISAEQAFVSYSEISGSYSHGIYISGRKAASVTYTDVTNAGYYGIYGTSWSINLLDISDSNVTGSYGYGIAYAQSVDNNYVADNDDAVGADTTNEGSVDGVRDASTVQVYGADAITNARSSAVSGTGPR